jgi:plastocyanin
MKENKRMKASGCTVSVSVIGLFLFHPIGATNDLPAQDSRGVIRGKVTLPAQVQVAPRAQTSRYRTTPPADASKTGNEKPDVANVVVYLEGAGLEQMEKNAKPAVLDQRDATFVPHVLPIVKGTQVRIVNRDKTYHNVFSLSKVKKFNIGRRPTGEEVPVDFDKGGEVQVFCDIHSNMSAIILVLDNPMFVQPNNDGVFEMKNVPPGQYTIRAWHERLNSTPKQVTVRAGEAVTMNFDFQ